MLKSRAKATASSSSSSSLSRTDNKEEKKEERQICATYVSDNSVHKGCQYVHDEGEKAFHDGLPSEFQQSHKNVVRGMTPEEYASIAACGYVCPHFLQQGCIHINQEFQTDMGHKAMTAILMGVPHLGYCPFMIKHKKELGSNLTTGLRHNQPGRAIADFAHEFCYLPTCTGCCRRKPLEDLASYQQVVNIERPLPTTRQNICIESKGGRSRVQTPVSSPGFWLEAPNFTSTVPK